MAIDVTESTFREEVLERSREKPVVVDFWATWCGPCRTLGPALERAVERRPEVLLAKVDVDSNQGLAQEYGIRGIPAVKAFRDGEMVDEFVGALPEAEVERFLDRVVPSEADALVAEGGEPALRRALELEPGRADAATALGRVLLERGESEEALSVLEPVVGDFAADGLAARARLALSGAAEEDASLREALEALDRSDFEQALEGLAGVLERTDEDTRDLVRQAMIGVFTELGADHPLSRTYRRRLASVLY